MDIAQRQLIYRYEKGKRDVGFDSRLKRTQNLLSHYLKKDTKVLDLGPDNLMRRKLVHHFGNQFNGTGTLDLNRNYSEIECVSEDLITSFEVFEHLFNLFPVLKRLRKFNRPMICSVPLRFPLSKQYWTEEYHDRHYNEFESNQIRWILSESGFKIVKEEYWFLDWNVQGVRPFLRSFLLPSWIALVCE